MLIAVPMLALGVFDTSTAPWFFSTPRAYLGMLLLFVVFPPYLLAISLVRLMAGMENASR